MSFPLHIAYVGQEIRILNLRCVLSGISLKIPVILKVTTLFNLNVFPRALTPPKYFFAIDSEITEVYGSFSAEESIPVISLTGNIVNNEEFAANILSSLKFFSSMLMIPPTFVKRANARTSGNCFFSAGPTAAHPAPHVVPVSYTHLRAHETDSYLVCRLL